MAFTVLYVVFPLQVERELGYDRHHVAYLFVMIGIVNAAGTGWADREIGAPFGERPLMVIGGVLLADGAGGTWSRAGWGDLRSTTSCLARPACVLVALGSGLVAPSATGLVSRVAPVEEQGRASGDAAGSGVGRARCWSTPGRAADQSLESANSFLGGGGNGRYCGRRAGRGAGMEPATLAGQGEDALPADGGEERHGAPALGIVTEVHNERSTPNAGSRAGIPSSGRRRSYPGCRPS